MLVTKIADQLRTFTTSFRITYGHPQDSFPRLKTKRSQADLSVSQIYSNTGSVNVDQTVVSRIRTDERSNDWRRYDALQARQ